MMDEQQHETRDEPQDEPPMTGDVHDVHDAPSNGLVAQTHGGKLRRNGGDNRVPNPTAADNAADANRRLSRLMPSIARIAGNVKDPRAKGKKAAARRGKHSVPNRLAAFRALIDTARLDRTVRESRLAAFLLKVQDEILEYLPREQADTLLRKIAVHVADL